MYEQNNLKLKIILSFSNAYQKLYEKGELNSKELDHVLSLIDDYEKYSPSDFKIKLEEIFNTNID